MLSQRDTTSRTKSEPEGARTSVTLLQKVRQVPFDQEAWSRFVDRYAPMVAAWCRARGLQDADADDVTQAVLVKLAGLLRRFDYDPSRTFRGWLRMIAENACRDLWADRPPPATGDSASLTNVEAREDLARRLERQYDIEILEQAKDRARGKVSPQTWACFSLTTDEGLSGAEAAARLGMQVAAVLKAKSNVLKRIREEVEALEARDPARPGWRAW